MRRGAKEVKRRMKLRPCIPHRTVGSTTGTGAGLRLIAFAPGALAAIVTLCLGAMCAWATTSADGAGGNNVVATVGKHEITEQELTPKIASQMARMQDRIYWIKRQAIESMVVEYLIAQAAKNENLSEDAYLKKQLAGPGATAAEAKKLYDEHAKQIGQPYEKMKDRLIAFLNNERQKQRGQALIARLRKGIPINIMLAPPRFAVASSGHPELGPAGAPVTMVEFGDFECPFCKRAEDTVKQLRTKYGDRIKLVYMDFPLPNHPHALDAAKAARCAGEQGKFWQYHDQLFADQSKLAPPDLKTDAKKLGLDAAQFDACLDQAKYEADVQRDIAEGKRLGVDRTPTFYIDGRMIGDAQQAAKFEEVIDEELAAKSGIRQAAVH